MTVIPGRTRLFQVVSSKPASAISTGMARPLSWIARSTTWVSRLL
jgi:hypothetical protein